MSFVSVFAAQQHFVIRYDYRDTGLSTCINFDENPYDLYDLASDALEILNAFAIQKAHVVGLSMGGSIAQILAANHSDRVLTVAMLMSSPDLSVKIKLSN